MAPPAHFIPVDQRRFNAALRRAETVHGRSAKREAVPGINDRWANYWSYVLRYVEVGQRVDTLANGSIVGSRFYIDPATESPDWGKRPRKTRASKTTQEAETCKP